MNPILEAQIREQAEREGKSVNSIIARPLWDGLQCAADLNGASSSPDVNDEAIRDPAYYAAAYLPGEVSEIGEKIYRDQIKAQMTEGDIGRILVIDVTTGNYDFQDKKNSVAVGERLRERNPKAVLYALRVGFPTAYKRGGHRGTR